MRESERTRPPRTADERAMLIGFLEHHRDTLEWKCSGLTPQQLRERAVGPSKLSLLGLVRHMTDVERGWFRRCVAGEDAPHLYRPPADRDGDFDHVDGATQADVDEAFDSWRAEVRRARQILEAASLDDTFHHWDKEFSVRWLLIHMIEEYARHNGHADLLRERVDGETGV